MAETTRRISKRQMIGGQMKAALQAGRTALYRWDVQEDSIKWLFTPTDACFNHLQECHNIRDLHSQIEPPDLALRLEALSQHMRYNEPYSCEYRLILPNGSRRWFMETGQIELSKDHTPLRLYASVHDINHLKAKEDSMGRLAIFDDLTGAYSEFRLKEMMEHSLAYLHRYGGDGLFLIIDIKDLTKINEEYGLNAGDLVVASVCHRLRLRLRSADTMGRLAGDRLGILLSNCPAINASCAVERLIEAATGLPIITDDGKEIDVNISIGSTRLPDIADTVADCFRFADIALTQAKEKVAISKDNVHVQYAAVEDSVELQQRLETVEATLRDAIDNDGFHLVFQPIISAHNKQVLLYECLIRLSDPSGANNSPADFVPIAEKVGVMQKIDLCVLQMVIKELLQYPDITLAFNISGATAGDHAWLRALQHELMEHQQTHPDLASRMVIEITETSAVGLTATTIDFIEQLRELGCRVALDDFGAGYTSFRQLKLLPLDIIKIDGAMVRTFLTNYQHQLFIRTLLDLCRAFKLDVIAEGIETEEQQQALVPEGVQMLQGYLYGAPVAERPWAQAGKAAKENVA